MTGALYIMSFKYCMQFMNPFSWNPILHEYMDQDKECFSQDFCDSVICYKSQELRLLQRLKCFLGQIKSGSGKIFSKTNYDMNTTILPSMKKLAELFIIFNNRSKKLFKLILHAWLTEMCSILKFYEMNTYQNMHLLYTGNQSLKFGRNCWYNESVCTVSECNSLFIVMS